MSTPIDNGGPAFPAATCGEWQIGMSLREWYAGMAMQGLCANQGFIVRLLDLEAREGKPDHDSIASASVQIADALIQCLTEKT